MSIWDSIGNAFKSAADATVSIADKIAIATTNGGNLFASGWKDVFSGDITQGFKEIGTGLAQCAGIVPSDPQNPNETLADRYTDAIAEANVYAAGLAQKSSVATCFSLYEQQVKANFLAKKLPWNDDMDATLRQDSSNFPWINMGC